VDIEYLVDVITKEVLTKLNGISDNKEQINQKECKILAIYTGGSIGFKQSTNEMAKIANWAEIDVLMSKTAAEIYSDKLIKEKCKAQTIIKDGEGIAVREILKDIRAIILPVMTFNTTAKLAAGICDTFVLNTVFRCLMTGIPVIAAKNAADLQDQERKIMSMYCTPGLIRLSKDNITKLVDLGIDVVDITQLAEKVEAVIINKSPKKQVEEKKKKIITQKDINEENIRQGYLRMPINAILTPLAKDVIQSHELKIYYE